MVIDFRLRGNRIGIAINGSLKIDVQGTVIYYHYYILACIIDCPKAKNGLFLQKTDKLYCTKPVFFL